MSTSHHGHDRKNPESGCVLIMTVGTGDITNLEETLLTPLRKSIAVGRWAEVILLPSSITVEFAERLRQDLEGLKATIRPLPEDAENDADRAYAHFDAVLSETVRRVRPGQVVADFTRGTKAMSAALVMAATRHEVPRLRYITGQRDRRGMVEAGSEAICSIGTTVVAGHRRLDLARDLMWRGSFAAVEAALPDPEHGCAGLYPSDLTEIARAVRTATQFYAAWDRLDYAAAAQVAVSRSPGSDWEALWPSLAMRDWVEALACETARSDSAAMSARLRRLVVDLLANGERRLRQGQHEDALVRAYRVLELIGQVRLFDRGLDSSNLDANHEAVQLLQKKIKKKKQAPLAERSDGTLLAGRFQVARILKECGDQLAQRLLDFEGKALLKPTLRNNSLLIHGFAARAPEDAESLRGLFEDLADLIRADSDPETVNSWLSVARAPAF